jgi:hypothetical protein
MLKGDLATTPLAPLLLQLAEEVSTGCLHISDGAEDEALVFYKNGLVYAVTVPGRRPQLGAKLVSSGALAPEALADALEAQRTELQGWRLGELLVHLGYVDQPVVEDFIKEQVHDALWDLIKWVDGPWKFRRNEKTREDVAPPMAVTDLLEDLRRRGFEWQTISHVVHGPAAVPVLSTRGGGSAETTLDPDAWSMLCKIDGERSIADLARDCGYTMFEAGQVLVALVNAGLVDIDEDLEDSPVADDEPYGATSVRSALAADAANAVEPEDGFAALARVVSEVAAGVRAEDAPIEEVAASVVDMPSTIKLNAGNDESFAASIARVSEALSDVLGPAPQVLDPFEVPHELRLRSKKSGERTPVSEEEARKTRARQAAAAELAAAHALAEALRATQTVEPARPIPEPVETVAEVVDLAEVRRGAEEAARIEAERLAAEEAARVAAEEEAARLEAERLEAERLAAEEAARLEAERVEAERLAAEETARLEAERLAAEEAARVAAEEEAARLEAERLAAEEAARLEAERVEAERLAAEEAARLEAERLAFEEGARLEAERLAAERAEAESEAWAEYWAREARVVEARSEHGQAAAAMLSDLHAVPIAEVPVQAEPEPEPEPVYESPEPAEMLEPAGVGARASGGMNEMADTAALLRELSSLGLEDDPAPAPSARPPAPRAPRPAAADKKKKRGLFGR